MIRDARLMASRLLFIASIFARVDFTQMICCT
jgi:hypothetical protein